MNMKTEKILKVIYSIRLNETGHPVAICNGCRKYVMSHISLLADVVESIDTKDGSYTYRVGHIRPHYECNAFEISVLLKGKRPPKWLVD